MTSQWLLLGAVALAATCIAVVIFLRATGHTVGARTRVVVGLSAVACAIFAGFMLGQKAHSPPEQLGLSVLVEGTHVRKVRNFDGGMFVSADVTLASCGDPVAVRYTMAPTAEFWIDNRDALRESAHISFGIPSDAITNISVLVGDDVSVPLPRPSVQRPQERLDDATVSYPDDQLTTVQVTVPRLGQTLTPVTLAFDADWTERRSLLGGCYLRLPALTGLPTAMTGARVRGLARPIGTPFENHESSSFFELESEALGRHAYYDPNLEVNHGVTVLHLGDYSLDQSLSAPAPSTSLGGLPAWTCDSSNVPGVNYINSTDPGDPAPDYSVKLNGAGGTFSTARLSDQLEQASCGSYVAIDDPSSGTRRDLMLLFIGALLSLGLELIVSSVGAWRRPGTGKAARLPRVD